VYEVVSLQAKRNYRRDVVGGRKVIKVPRKALRRSGEYTTEGPVYGPDPKNQKKKKRNKEKGRGGNVFPHLLARKGQDREKAARRIVEECFGSRLRESSARKTPNPPPTPPQPRDSKLWGGAGGGGGGGGGLWCWGGGGLLGKKGFLFWYRNKVLSPPRKNGKAVAIWENNFNR